MTIGFEVSQGYTVLRPRSGEAYPVPCDEWDRLKERLRLLATPPWFFQNVGSILIGAGLGTAMQIGMGAFAGPQNTTDKVIASAIAISSLLCGALAWMFAHQQRNLKTIFASEIIAQMELIEARYDRIAITTPSRTPDPNVEVTPST